MAKEEFYITNSQGEKVCFTTHTPENTPPVAVIGLVHGMGEHSDRYKALQSYFINKSIAFIAFDQVGHGKSTGKRGHVLQYDHLLDNIDLLLLEAKSRFPDVPFVLMGHSMGGNLVLNYLLRRPNNDIKASIVSSPWIKLAKDPSVFTVGLVKYLHRFFPALAQKTELNTIAISRDPKIVKEYMLDPLVHNRITLRFFTQTYMAGLWVLKNANLLKTPLLLYHGTADKITSFKASKEFYDKCPHKKLIQFQALEGYFHEPHNDLGNEVVFNEITSFLNEKLLLSLKKD